MKRIRQAISIGLIFALAGIYMVAEAQYQQPYRVTEREVNQLLRRIENRADRFKNSLGRALDRSRLDNTRREDNINQLVADFEQATNQLRERFNNRTSTTSDVQMVLDRAAWIDRFMQRRQLANNAEQQWSMLRNDLNQLANYYNVSWNWSNLPPGYDTPGYGSDNLLTGTYRLNSSMSDDPRTAIERAVRGLPSQQRDRAYNALLRRVSAPDMLAIERRGQTITLASSHTAQATFEADGRERTEQYPNSNRTSRVRADLKNNQLVISSSGDRASDFTVTFDPIDNGRRLRVTRSLYSDRLSQPVVVQSTYDQIADVARWNIYTGSPYGRRGPDRTRGDYTVPDDMVLVTRLNEDLHTDRTQSGDRFTLTVISPSRYEGATIEGYVANVDRGGRITGRSEMALNLERIRLRNGQTYAFEGIIESVRTADGETVRVDTEGAVREDDTQTERTVTRSAIGAVVGAVIGAIAGGGSGAAIGAVVGAGAGAGSVYVQGRNDLEMDQGTEITLRAVAPRATAIR
jgi:outer membrane lipoprotein SlyB